MPLCLNMFVKRLSPELSNFACFCNYKMCWRSLKTSIVTSMLLFVANFSINAPVPHFPPSVPPPVSTTTLRKQRVKPLEHKSSFNFSWKTICDNIHFLCCLIFCRIFAFLLFNFLTKLSFIFLL